MLMDIYGPTRSVPVSVTTRKNDNGVGVCAAVKGRSKRSRSVEQSCWRCRWDGLHYWRVWRYPCPWPGRGSVALGPLAVGIGMGCCRHDEEQARKARGLDVHYGVRN